MTVAVLAVGTTGDVWPMIAIANRLAKAGHRVRVATHDVFRAAVEQSGLEFAPVPPSDSLAVLSTHDGAVLLDPFRTPIAHYRALHRLYGSLFDGVASACVEAAGDATLIVRSTLSLIGLHIAQARRIGSVDIQLQPLPPSAEYAHPLAYQYLPERLLGSRLIRRASHRVAESALHRPFARGVQHWRERLGLDRSRATTFALGRALGEHRIHLYSETLVGRPREWGKYDLIAGSWQPTPNLTMPTSHVQIPDEFVLMTFGSLRPPASERLVALFAEAAGRLGFSVVLAGAAVKDERVMKTAHSDFRHLLPRARAVVHHGGSGTTGLALRHGTPQVVVPFFYDQFFWASRVADRGVGVNARGAERARAQVAQGWLTSAISMQRRVSHLAARARDEDGVTVAAAAIERAM